jgi:AcrR family transcriptional regulator
VITNHPRETPEATACRGRPRSAAADTAIIETVLRLLEEGATTGGLTMEGIARSAGVDKATIYRRWPGKDALLMDVLRTLNEPTPELPGRSVRDDLALLVEFVRRCGPAKRDSAVLRNVMLQFLRARAAAGLLAGGGAVRADGRHGARRSAPARMKPVPTPVH